MARRRLCTAGALGLLVATAAGAEPAARPPSEQLDGQPREKIYPPAHLFTKRHVPTHSNFVWAGTSGTIELEANRTLRLALVGTGQKRWLELRPPRAADHEHFNFEDGGIHLKVKPTLCLGAEESALPSGVRIMLQACEGRNGTAAPHQRFSLGLDGRIRSVASGRCMNPRGGIAELGTEIVLDSCKDALFAHWGGLIKLRQNPLLHFNVQGAAEDGPIVLWKSEGDKLDTFELLESGQFRLTMLPSFCLWAKNGVAQGNEIIGWKCSKEEPTPNELFGFDDMQNVIYAKSDTNLVFNVKGGNMAPGGTIVLWPHEKWEKKRKPNPEKTKEL